MIPLALFVLALVTRGLFLLEIAGGPMLRIPLVDAKAYHDIARQLAESGQLDERFFWQPFFYPFLLSGVYAVTGSSILAAKMVQAILGAVTCVLTYVLGRRNFGRGVGVIAGIIVALYGPLIFFECNLVASGIAALWSLVLILLMLNLRDRVRPALVFVYGLLGALAILTRPTFLPFLLAGSVWLAVLIYRRSGGRGLVTRCLVGFAGFAMAALPVAVTNQQRGLGEFTILPFSGGINFYVGNNANPCETLTARPGWDWEKLQVLPYRMGVEHRSDHQAFFYRKVGDYALAQPVAFLGNLCAKGARFLSSREIPRNVDVYVFRQWSGLLSVSVWKGGGFGFPFGVLLPLAALGAWRLRRRIPLVIWLFLVFYSLSVIVVFVSDRYRVPIIPVLSILAAGGIVSLAEMVRARQGKRLIVASGIVVGTVLLSCLPGPFCEEKLDYNAELDYLRGRYHFQEAQSAAGGRAAAEHIRAARECYERAIARRANFADAWNELGNVEYVIGRHAEAAKCYGIVLDYRPDHGKAWHNTGLLYYESGKNEQAVVSFRRALDLDPSFGRSYYWLGRALLTQRSWDEAVDVLREGIRREANPSQRAEGHCAIAEGLLALGRAREAVEEYRQALVFDPGCARAVTGLAWLLATHESPELRDGAAALRLAEQAVTSDQQDSQALDALAAAYAEIGRFPEAVEVGKMALGAARHVGEDSLAAQIERRLRLYEGGMPYRWSGR